MSAHAREPHHMLKFVKIDTGLDQPEEPIAPALLGQGKPVDAV